jgi:hypothetical protein
MNGSIILTSFAVVVVTYFIFSVRVGNYINILTPFLFFEVPAHYVLELVHWSIFGDSASTFAYFYCYSIYTAGVVAMAIGYLAVPDRPVPVLLAMPKLKVPAAPYLFLFAAAVLYAPILIEYSAYITAPREIYAATRTGYGAQFTLSSFGVYAAFILFLFWGKHRWYETASFIFVCVLILYLHGSKGMVLNFFFIGLYFLVFVRNSRFGLRRLLGIGIAISAITAVLFYLTLSGAVREDLVEGISGYSDYTRNAMMVMDDRDLLPQWGRLTLEDSVYAVVPRAVFPNKPLDFGALWLAKRYYPERFTLNTGAPAFGIGLQYADFGVFSIFYVATAWLLTGMFMKVLVAKLRIRPDAGTFFLLLVMLNVTLIPAGAAVPLIFYYACALVIRCLSRDRLSTSGTTRTQHVTSAAG